MNASSFRRAAWALTLDAGGSLSSVRRWSLVDDKCKRGIQAMHRLATLPSIHRRELARAVMVVSLARLALWLTPFRFLSRLMSRLGRARGSRKAATESAVVDRIAWAVVIAARIIPAATCLVQAMATQFLLGWHGIESTLRLGVTRAADESFRAHAWVECRGRIVVGGNDSPMVYSVFSGRT
jgi:hypothetical protein